MNLIIEAGSCGEIRQSLLRNCPGSRDGLDLNQHRRASCLDPGYHNRLPLMIIPQENYCG